LCKIREEKDITPPRNDLPNLRGTQEYTEVFRGLKSESDQIWAKKTVFVQTLSCEVWVSASRG